MEPVRMYALVQFSQLCFQRWFARCKQRYVQVNSWSIMSSLACGQPSKWHAVQLFRARLTPDPASRAQHNTVSCCGYLWRSNERASRCSTGETPVSCTGASAVKYGVDPRAAATVNRDELDVRTCHS